MESDKYNLPLERLLELVCDDSSATTFPKPENYYERYCEITSQLKREVYKGIDTALAVLSKEVGLYTSHGADHFDEVVKYAGLLLGLSNNRSDVEDVCEIVLNGGWILTPYEIYVLLLSVRVHDIGNIYGRENHEKNISRVIHDKKIVYLHKDRIESQKIASIAGAHGGKTREGDKDTIGNLMDTGHDGHTGNIDHKKIAAITRFADEVCENRQRVESFESMVIPSHNIVFHKYAAAMIGNHISDNTLHLTLNFHIGDLTANYQIYETKNGTTELKGVTLPEITLERLKKTELERRYCNRFIPENIQIKKIFVKIVILEDDRDSEEYVHNTIKCTEFTLKEEGYPTKIEVVIDAKTIKFMNYNQLCSERLSGDN